MEKTILLGMRSVIYPVDDIDFSFVHFTQNGAVVVREIEEVGGDIKTAILRSAAGEIFGLIFNPHFQSA